MNESEQSSVGSDDESEEKSTSEGNEDETDEDQDGSDSGALPKFNIRGPGKVNIKHSQGVKIGNTIKMKIKVDKMIVQNEAIQQPPDTAAIAGYVANRLTEVLQGNAANQCFPIEIPALLDSSSSSNCTLVVEEAAEEESAECPRVQNSSSALVRHSPEVTSEIQECCHDTWWTMLLNDERLQSEILQNTSLAVNTNESEVSVDSLIDEFVQSINNFIIVTQQEDIKTPEFGVELDLNIFKRKITSGGGRLSKYQPLVRERKIDIEIMDNLVYLKIPLYIENLKITFSDFTFGLGDFSVSGINVEVNRTDICLVITAAPNQNGSLDTDVTKEVTFDDIAVVFTGNVAEQALLLLIKNKMKKFIRDEYMVNIVSKLNELISDVISGGLLYDFCCKLISLYDIG